MAVLAQTKRLGDDVRMARKAQPVKGALPLASLYHMQEWVRSHMVLARALKCQLPTAYSTHLRVQLILSCLPFSVASE